MSDIKLDAPHTAEVFNAILGKRARSVLVDGEVKGCCFTACFYVLDQLGGESDTHETP